MSRRQITYFNIFSIVSVLVLLTITFFDEYSLTNIVRFILTLYIMFLLPGFNLVYLLEHITNRRYDLAVVISLAFIFSLLIPPLVVITVYQIINYINLSITLAVYLSFALIPSLYHLTIFFLHRRYQPVIVPALKFPKISFLSTISHPVFVVFLILTLSQSFNLTRFSFLPTPDSYSWLISFENSLPDNKILIGIDSGRRSFSAFVAAIYYLSNINLFSLFKTAFPFLSLLIIPPLWLAARLLPNKTTQIVFMLAAAFISPTVILELEYTRQQVIFLIFLYYFIGLQIYASFSNDSTLHKQPPTKLANSHVANTSTARRNTPNTSIFYLLILLSIVGTTVHPAFSIISLLSIAVLVLSHLSFLWKHRFLTLLAFLLAYPWAKKATIVNIYERISEQAIGSFKTMIAARWNLKFPTYFVNSDGYEMSWPGLSGLTKYYSYYVGLISLLTLLTLILMVIGSKSFRKRLISLFTNQYFLNIFFPFSLFFLIAEIAPRFGNIAYLPDRAWQYLSIIIVYFLFLLIHHFSRSSPIKSWLINTILIVLVVINFGGAAYINNLTKYTVPDYELRAARWLKENVTGHSYIISATSKNLIRYHLGQTYVGAGSAFYYNDDPADLIEQLTDKVDVGREVPAELERSANSLAHIAANATEAKNNISNAMNAEIIYSISYDQINEFLDSIEAYMQKAKTSIATANALHDHARLIVDKLPPIYIYYAKTHPSNPYATRPYKSSFTANQQLNNFPALDNNPDLFERVYTDDDRVIIWFVKTRNFKDV